MAGPILLTLSVSPFRISSYPSFPSLSSPLFLAQDLEAASIAHLLTLPVSDSGGPLSKTLPEGHLARASDPSLPGRPLRALHMLHSASPAISPSCCSYHDHSTTASGCATQAGSRPASRDTAGRVPRSDRHQRIIPSCTRSNAYAAGSYRHGASGRTAAKPIGRTRAQTRLSRTTISLLPRFQRSRTSLEIGTRRQVVRDWVLGIDGRRSDASRAGHRAGNEQQHRIEAVRLRLSATGKQRVLVGPARAPEGWNGKIYSENDAASSFLAPRLPFARSPSPAASVSTVATIRDLPNIMEPTALGFRKPL